ncbi:hypothetical protein HYV87_05015 [Candidatus Woesearchaeota archaeon]|nr:hypothetical protein [Candidatus Woesearchaeota archaeon]
MALTPDTLKEIVDAKGLQRLQPNSEIILVHSGIGANASFTVHGRFVELPSSGFVTVRDYLHLPIECRIDPEAPGELLTFLRAFPESSHYPRISKPECFNYFGNPGNLGEKAHRRFYQVETR